MMMFLKQWMWPEGPPEDPEDVLSGAALLSGEASHQDQEWMEGSHPWGSTGENSSPPAPASVQHEPTVDPIDPEIVGKVRSDALLQDALQAGLSEEWATTLLSTIRAEEPWCGRNGLKWNEIAEDSDRMSPQSLHKVVDALLGSIVRAVGSKFFFGGSLGFVKIFTVVKDVVKLRVIANCVKLNKLFDKPPTLKFATIRDLFYIMAFFGPSRSFFAISDFRHWFYQLPLPKFMGRYFRLGCSTLFTEFVAWPMGFSWSPFVAQGHSMTLAWMAIQSMDKGLNLYCVPSNRESSVIPPFWIVKQGRTAGVATHREDKTRAFMVFWYDNWLLVTDCKELRLNIVHAMDKTANRYCARWKIPVGPGSEKGFGHGMGAFTFSDNEVEYLGMRFRFNPEGTEEWSHPPKNKLKWRKLVYAISNKRLDFRSFKEAASLTGVLTWHWSVGGAPKSELTTARMVNSLVRTNMTETSKWKDHATGIREKTWNTLLKEVQTLTEGDVWYRRPAQAQMRPSSIRRVASDACNFGLGGVSFDTHLTWSEPVRPEHSKEHITRKELRAALITLEWELGNVEPNTLVCLACDNVATVSSLRKGLCPYSDELDGILQKLLKKYKGKNCAWEATYIKGEDNPADCPSRLKEMKEGLLEKGLKALDLARYNVWDGLLRENE